MSKQKKSKNTKADEAAIQQAEKTKVAIKKATKKLKLKFKAGDWVVVHWSDAPDELGYVMDPKPTKAAQFAELIFLRGKASNFQAVNYDQIVAVAGCGLKIAGFEARFPGLLAGQIVSDGREAVLSFS